MQEKIMKKIGQKATSFALALGIAVAGFSPANAASVNLAGGGATFQADFQSKCLASFNAQAASARKVTPSSTDDVKVSYAGVGSGAGRTGLANGTYAFAGADSLGKVDATTGNTGLTPANSVWFPVAAAPLAIIVKLSGISSLRLDTLTLSQVLNGTITTWNDPKIVALNSGLTLPSTRITVVSRADTSGSTGNLKTYLNKNLTALGASTSTASAANKALANLQKVKWTSGGQTQADEFARGGIGATGSPALVAAVGSANGRIGYADLSDVTSDLTIVTMQNVAGQWVKPTAASAALYVAASGVLTPDTDTTYTNNGGIYKVDFTKSVANAYQITFITYFVGKKGLGTKNDQVRLYANYVLKSCSPTPSIIGATGYVTVGSALIANAKLQVAKITNTN